MFIKRNDEMNLRYVDFYLGDCEMSIRKKGEDNVENKEWWREPVLGTEPRLPRFANGHFSAIYVKLNFNN